MKELQIAGKGQNFNEILEKMRGNGELSEILGKNAAADAVSDRLQVKINKPRL